MVFGLCPLLHDDGVAPNDVLVQPIAPDEVLAPNEVLTPNDVVAPDDVGLPDRAVAPHDVVAPNNVVTPDDVVAPDNVFAPRRQIAGNAVAPYEVVAPDHELRPGLRTVDVADGRNAVRQPVAAAPHARIDCAGQLQRAIGVEGARALRHAVVGHPRRVAHRQCR